MLFRSILGLMPVSRDQILRGKFAFAATGSLLIAETLVLASDVLIGLPWAGVVLHAAAVAVIALGLSAINVVRNSFAALLKRLVSCFSKLSTTSSNFFKTSSAFSGG